MKIFKLFLVLCLCLAVLCQNDFSLEVDALSVSVSDNLVPFFKVMEGGNIYYLRLQSIYEIQQQNDSLWYRVPGTETLFSALNWNISSSLSDGTFTLFGSPCPCDDAPPQQEPVLGKRFIKGSQRRSIRNSNCNNNGGNDGGNGGTPPGNQGTDNGTDTGNNNNNNICPTVNFEYVKLFFQIDKNCSKGGNGGNGGDGGSGNNTFDADACNTTCVSACDSADNVTNCLAFCNAFYNVTFINETICNSTCLVDNVLNTDCQVACNSWSTCFNNSIIVDADQCNSTCVTSCDEATNSSNCVAFCNSFYNVTFIDETICNSTCIVNDVVDADCLVACYSWATCFNGTSGNNGSNTPDEPAACTLTLNYHLHKYKFSNLSTVINGSSDFQGVDTNGTRLAFAFEVISESTVPACRTFFDNWFTGPFNIKLNVSTLALADYPADDANLDITNATQVESNLVYALRDNIVVGRIYVNQFADGSSIFNARDDFVVNQPPANNTDNTTTITKRNWVKYDYPI